MNPSNTYRKQLGIPIHLHTVLLIAVSGKTVKIEDVFRAGMRIGQRHFAKPIYLSQMCTFTVQSGAPDIILLSIQ